MADFRFGTASFLEGKFIIGKKGGSNWPYWVEMADWGAENEGEIFFQGDFGDSFLACYGGRSKRKSKQTDRLDGENVRKREKRRGKLRWCEKK